MRKPKSPAGFVPVDSEEAKGIGDDVYVNVAYRNGETPYEWSLDTLRMRYVRTYSSTTDRNYHVQLPPPVEWEEVWGWKEREDGVTWITYNGVPFENIGNRAWTFDQLNTIVRALNEMEGQ